MISLLTIVVHCIFPVLTFWFPLIVTVSFGLNYLQWSFCGRTDGYREMFCMLTAITIMTYITCNFLPLG